MVHEEFLWGRMRSEDGQIGEGVVDLGGNGYVGQQHELLNQFVAVTVLVEAIAL